MSRPANVALAFIHFAGYVDATVSLPFVQLPAYVFDSRAALRAIGEIVVGGGESELSLTVIAKVAE